MSPSTILKPQKKKTPTKPYLIENQSYLDNQVRIIVKQLLPIFSNHLFAMPLVTFKQLYDSSLNIEEAIHVGKHEKKRLSLLKPQTLPIHSLHYPPLTLTNQD